MHVTIGQHEVVRREFHDHGFGLAWVERHSLKTTKKLTFLHRHRSHRPLFLQSATG